MSVISNCPCSSCENGVLDCRGIGDGNVECKFVTRHVSSPPKSVVVACDAAKYLGLGCGNLQDKAGGSTHESGCLSTAVCVRIDDDVATTQNRRQTRRIYRKRDGGTANTSVVGACWPQRGSD